LAEDRSQVDELTQQGGFCPVDQGCFSDALRVSSPLPGHSVPAAHPWSGQPIQHRLPLIPPRKSLAPAHLHRRCGPSQCVVGFLAL